LPNTAGSIIIYLMKLNSKTALITGSTGKLGSSIALRLANAGCDCICHYNTNSQKADELVQQIQAVGRNSIAVKADLTNQDQIEQLFEQAEKFAVPTILINCASVFQRIPLENVTYENARQTLDINLTAAILTGKVFAQKVKRHFIRSDISGDKSPIAKIINITDIGGIRPWAGYVLYCSSKAGLIGATKSLAKELAPYILVNSIAPGIFAWPANFDQSQKKRQLNKIPANRIGKLEELTAAILFLLENDYITGQNLNVDGGRCI